MKVDEGLFDAFEDSAVKSNIRKRKAVHAPIQECDIYVKRSSRYPSVVKHAIKVLNSKSTNVITIHGLGAGK